MSNKKTIIACRPGMRSAMESAFAGMKVVVDDTLTKDYEFREESMTFEEIMEAEISKEERLEADPKSAVTVLVPLPNSAEDVKQDAWFIRYLAIRTPSGTSPFSIATTLKDVEPTLEGDPFEETVNVSATIGSVKAALKKAGIEVYSISEAEGLTPLGKQ